MYTSQENFISNKSYTDKDFQSIFPELLDAVSKLTNKWDPSSSNESDPGVVLLKLGALLADKNNYNIDKNILETFPLSVTQQANARKLYDMLGYNMGWYKAAKTEITVTYTGSYLTDGKTIQIPKYTMFTDDSGEIIYTLTETIKISERGIAYTGDALQGTIVDYEVNGVKDITLDNLDPELRIFFTDRMVAQNGIFITNKSIVDDPWTRVDNLETQELGSRVYKFGIIPNTDTCYIQFPQDIGNLIGGGLNIKYIITSGLSGNVQANKITTLYQDLVVGEGDNTETINEDLVVKNIASTNSGSDPEDIDSAYHNYKKTIGTFDTLVTIRDYENAVYRAEDGYGVPYISNGVVSDRTCDINYTTKVVELTPQGTVTKLFLDKDSQNIPLMDAFDIGLYVLNPMVSIYDKEYYFNKSFSAVTTQEGIQSKLQDYKVSSHEFLPIDENLPYVYKNFYTLNGKIVTYHKVTDVQAQDIEDNVKKALFKKYNARNVDFGQPIDYDDIISTIQNADTRIKTVILSEPEYELRYTTFNDLDGSYTSSKSLMEVLDEGTPLILKLLARMILSGNVQLYKFDKDIQYKFGQTNIQQYPDIRQMTTKSDAVGGDKDSDVGVFSSNGYTIKKNQNVQVYSPNLYVETSYVSYVNYSLVDTANAYTITVDSKTGDSWKVVLGTTTYVFGVKSGVSGTEDTLVLYQDGGDVNSGKAATINEQNSGDNTVAGYFDDVSIGQSTYTLHFVATMNNSSENPEIQKLVFKYGSGTFEIKQGVYYQLTSSQCIKINYTDSDDRVVFKEIPSGTIVKFTDNNDPNAILKTTKSTIEKGGVQYSTLTASQQLDVLAVNKKKIENSNLHCMWFTNDYQRVESKDGDDSINTIVYTLFKDGQDTKVLQDNEYFIYTNDSKSELVMLGSGTMLKRNTEENSAAVTMNTKINVSDVISDGTTAIEDNDWRIYNAKKYGLTAIELQIVTLGEGAIISADYNGNESRPSSISTDPVKVKNVKYKETKNDDSFIPLDEYDLTDSMYDGVYVGWSMTSKMNLMMGNDYPQKIGDSAQSLELYSIIQTDKGTNATIKMEVKGQDNAYVMSNSILAFSGGEDISVSSNKKDAEINVYRYIKEQLPKFTIYSDWYKVTSLDQYTTDYNADGTLTVSFFDFASNNSPDKESGIKEDLTFSTTASGNIEFKFPFSFGGGSQYEISGEQGIYYNLDTKLKNIIVPVVLVGDNTEVTLIAYDTVGNDLDDTEVKLSPGSPVGYIEFKEQTVGTRFGGIRVSSWKMLVPDEIKTSSGVTINDLVPPVDFLRIEKIFVADALSGSDSAISKYSEQVATTTQYITNLYNLGKSNNISVDSMLNKLENLVNPKLVNPTDYSIVSPGNNFTFNRTYIVPDSDKIDTDVTIEQYKNNLFLGDAVWDINHICNKYTIPQLNTSKLSIKVTPSSIK